MTETIEIAAESRTKIGKSAKALAREGKLPAVLYGAGVGSKPIQLDRHEFEQIAAREGVTAMLFKVSVDGHKPVNAMIKELAHDRVRGTLVHVDFWAIKMNQPVTTVVPLNYLGPSAGEKAGGVLLHEMREVHIEALPSDLPEHVDVDTSALQVGDSLHVRDITPPQGVTILDDPDTIVCSVTPPQKGIEAEAAAAEEGAEPEVIGKQTAEE
ncbi:MAG: 50S ribosomal protein L25 [Coriobacteriia bacterium]|nr:50S ribosomal protein L25 [Coriobacteriia bacterium]